MATPLSDAHRQLLDGKNFGYLGTVNEDGSVQINPVWVDTDGVHAIFNTEKHRTKAKNLRRDPRATLTISTGSDPYHYVEIRGRVVEFVEEGAGQHIDQLAQKYLGTPTYALNQPGDVRVIVKLLPERILARL